MLQFHCQCNITVNCSSQKARKSFHTITKLQCWYFGGPNVFFFFSFCARKSDLSNLVLPSASTQVSPWQKSAVVLHRKKWQYKKEYFQLQNTRMPYNCIKFLVIVHDFYSANIYFSYSPISNLPISDKISLYFPQHTLLGWVPVSSPYHSLLLGAFYPPNAFFLVTFKPASFISSHLAPVYERTLLLADWFAVLRALPSPSLPLPPSPQLYKFLIRYSEPSWIWKVYFQKKLHFRYACRLWAHGVNEEPKKLVGVKHLQSPNSSALRWAILASLCIASPYGLRKQSCLKLKFLRVDGNWK